VIPAAVDYVRPSSVDEALEQLADPEAKAIAGGHSLVPLMKLRLARPGRLVDLDGLDLRGVSVDGDTLRIGALTTYDDLLSLDESVPLPAALRDCAASVGDLQVRNAGTIGGALAHGDPASDFAAGAIAVGATFVLRSPNGTREVAAEEFFVGPFTTVLEQQELLVELRVPVGAAPSAYVSFDDPASGYPLAGAAVCGDIVGLTGVGAQPLRAPDDLDELGLDDYRRQLVSVAIERAREAAR
jgi:aerobic carbon-monoxide dehydrogenase medium subunit